MVLYEDVKTAFESEVRLMQETLKVLILQKFIINLEIRKFAGF
jgi:hypothetical protein